MKRIVIVVMLGFLAGSPRVTLAAVIKVTATDFGGTRFIPDSVQVASGDTVRWERDSGDHTTTSGTGTDDPEAGMMYNSLLNLATPMFSFQFNTPGSYSNFCIPHGDPEAGGMTAQIVVTPPVQEYVSTTPLLFTEDSVEIAPGETVEFYNGTGEHTLTNGTGIADPNAGNTINSILGATIPAIQITFNVAGTYPFFCIPHEENGMFTTVYVVDPLACVCSCHADPTCDGAPDVLDVVATVGVAFRGSPAMTDPDCPRERTDVDCSGATDVLDVVSVVGVAFRGADPSTQFCDPCL